MIILTEVAAKLEKILNGADGETSGYTNPTNFYYSVQTEGFHIDSIARPDRTGNFIPVFVSSLGGQFNPVKGIKQASYSIPVIIYYPVRFKNDFFALGEFLEDVFVGSSLNYGAVSGRAISNISVPQYGEIQNLDFKEFKTWIEANYEKTIDVMEPYMTLQFTLFLSNSAAGLVYGNDVKVDLSFKHGNDTYILEDIAWDGASLQSNSQAQSEQEENADVPESDSLPFGTAYGASFKIYPNLNTTSSEPSSYNNDSGTYDPDAIYYTKSGNNYIYRGHLTEEQYELFHQGGATLYIGVFSYFYKEFLKIWLQGKIQEVECELSFKIANDNDLVYTRKCFIQSVMAPIEKGQLFALTLTFAKKTEEEQNG